MKLDFEFTDDGPVILLTPLSQRAHQWVKANIADDRQWFGGALLVERTFAPALVEGMVSDGMLFGALSENYTQ